MSIENEPDLIRRAQEGEQRAVRALIDEYAPVVYKFSFHICRDRDKAENTMQETFLSVLKNLKQFDNRSKFSTWLYTIVSNHCLMMARSARPGRFVSLDDEESPLAEEHLTHAGANPLEQTVREDLRLLLDRAIDQLAPDYRLVFALRDIEGLSTEEVAEVLHLSVPAVKSRLHRARKFLRDYLTPYLKEEPHAAS